MTIQEINNLQKIYGLSELQNFIDSGQVWKTAGSIGRSAITALIRGWCILSDESCYDAYGNYVPSRGEVQAGTMGSLELASQYWDSIKHIIMN